MTAIFLLSAVAFLLIYWITAWTFFLALAKICVVINIEFWLIMGLVAIFKKT